MRNYIFRTSFKFNDTYDLQLHLLNYDNCHLGGFLYQQQLLSITHTFYMYAPKILGNMNHEIRQKSYILRNV